MTQQSSSSSIHSEQSTHPKAANMDVLSAEKMQHSEARMVDYTFKDVNIPDEFLTGPSDKSVEAHIIDFAHSNIPEYADKKAMFVDNALSPAECNQLLKSAEEAAPWSKAMVNVKNGKEQFLPDERKCDRIIWDNQTMVDRLQERIIQLPEVKEFLSRPPRVAATPEKEGIEPDEWVYERFNDRMRFLKYEEGDFFKPHHDGTFRQNEDGKELASHYTVHGYLNDSTTESPPPQGAFRGGATPFVSQDGKRKMDIEPKAGRVLIFQHKGLKHAGAIVEEGVKFTMRTDIMYRRVRKS